MRPLPAVRRSTTSAGHGDDVLTSKSPPAGLQPRLLAAKRLADILKGQAFSPFSDTEIADGRDRALANRLVTTALRRHGHLNVVMARLLVRGMPKRSGLFEPVLRLALTELLFMDGQAEHSAVFLASEILKQDRRGAHLNKLLNGVLRQAQRQADDFKMLEPALLVPPAFLERWRQSYSDDAVKGFAQALLAGAPLDLTLRDERPELVQALGGEKVIADSYRVQERDRPVRDLPGYEEGAFWVQDVASALPSRLIGLEPGARVLDLFAAPGGKTAQLCKAGYVVTALDNNSERMTRLETNLKRVGYSADLVTMDATTYTPNERFDAVLFDAPCSATGTFRRHPEVLWHRSRKDVVERAKFQRSLMHKALDWLKPGGVFIYCTCSLEEEEGEAQARWLSEKVPGLSLLPIAAEEIGGFAEALTAEGWVRTHPALTAPGQALGALDGFFIARFRAK